jgi:hypothetical protein
MTSMSAKVISRAIAWWEARRSAGWTLAQHLENPAVNCASGFESALARSAANVMRGRSSKNPKETKA